MKLEEKLQGAFACLYKSMQGGLASWPEGGRHLILHPLQPQLAPRSARPAGRSIWKGQLGVGGASLFHFHFQKPYQDILSYLKTQIRNHKLFPNHAPLTFVMLIFLLINVLKGGGLIPLMPFIRCFFIYGFRCLFWSRECKLFLLLVTSHL